MQKFKHYFLPKAMTDDEIEEDRKEGRTVKDQLSSFGFFDMKRIKGTGTFIRLSKYTISNQYWWR